ncbi:hypothetical protein, partial [Streptomyces echinatus]|uniref:hypothetical protein n=1 Tax=Streptomyces echinatus TaxID=67293 RepID=UPI0037AF3EEC
MTGDRRPESRASATAVNSIQLSVASNHCMRNFTHRAGENRAGGRDKLVRNRQKQQIATAIASAAMVGGIVSIGTPASAAATPNDTVSIAQARTGTGTTQAHHLLPDKPCKHNCNTKPNKNTKPGNTQGGTQGGGGGNTQGGTQGGGTGNTQGGTQGGGTGNTQGGTQGGGTGNTQGGTQGGGTGNTQGGTQGGGTGNTQ